MSRKLMLIAISVLVLVAALATVTASCGELGFPC